MGAPVVWFLEEGILVIEATPAALSQLQAAAGRVAGQIASNTPGVTAKAYATADELKTLMDYASDAFKGDALLSGIKVVGSAAWSGAVTVGATPVVGPASAISAGIYMGKKYDDLFDISREFGSQLGLKFYELTHPEVTTINSLPNGLDLNKISYDTNGNVISSLITSLQTQFGTAEQTRSPLILDLDGLNGVETLGKTAGVHFDHDGNKFAEQSGWVGKNDGMLVWDRNGNKQIAGGADLFGNKPDYRLQRPPSLRRCQRQLAPASRQLHHHDRAEPRRGRRRIFAVDKIRNFNTRTMAVNASIESLFGETEQCFESAA